VSECCLTCDECCEYAGPNQQGLCIENMCKFVPDLECRADAGCGDRLSATLCRLQGVCFRPYCLRGVCECFDGTDADLDEDGVPCPDDCDDLDPEVSRRLVCVRDADHDQYPECAEDEDETCMVFCVEPNATCPRGFLDMADRNSERPHSVRTEGESCAAAGESRPLIDAEDCDCCDRDKRAFPGSIYIGSAATNCGDADFNCDGFEEKYACCEDGAHDAYHAFPSARYLWHTNSAGCYALPEPDEDACGGCSTVPDEGSGPNVGVHELGWACESNCSLYETPVSLVGEGDCPNACDSRCDCVDPGTEPVLGRCAKAVTACTEVRPGLFSDLERCCVLAVH